VPSTEKVQVQTVAILARITMLARPVVRPRKPELGRKPRIDAETLRVGRPKTLQTARRTVGDASCAKRDCRHVFCGSVSGASKLLSRSLRRERQETPLFGLQREGRNDVGRYRGSPCRS
jgi:hypothetical protein